MKKAGILTMSLLFVLGNFASAIDKESKSFPGGSSADEQKASESDETQEEPQEIIEEEQSGQPILESGSLEDVVYLRNGSIIRGTLIETAAEDKISLRTRDGSVFVFQVDEVDKIMKEEPFVQRTSYPDAPVVPQRNSAYKVGGGIAIAAGAAALIVGAALYQGEDEVQITESRIEGKESNKSWTIPLMAVGGVSVLAGAITLITGSREEDKKNSESWGWYRRREK